jgi:hypothetical protein
MVQEPGDVTRSVLCAALILTMGGVITGLPMALVTTKLLGRRVKVNYCRPASSILCSATAGADLRRRQINGATMAIAGSTFVVERERVRQSDHMFYCGMSLAIAALVFAGFSRTFYLASLFHARPLSPLRVVHGSLFSAWVLLFVVQTTLVATRRTAIHRRLGVGGAVLAATMVVVGTVMAITSAREGHAPPGVPPLAFLAVPLFDMLVFAPLVAAGIYFRRRPEIHKRLMLLATISLMGAPAARLPTALAAAGPFFYFGVVDLLLLSGVLYDLATRRKVHPVYVWGGLLLIVSQPLRLMLGGTGVWLAFAGMLVGR